MTSQASRDYLNKLRMRPPFGANGFSLEYLRVCMQATRRPTIDGVHCINVEIDHIPATWVVAPGADPDVRLLYLHGGGYISGSAAFYLAMAAQLSNSIGCAVLMPDYRLAPEHPFPQGLHDCIVAYDWLAENGPNGFGHATTTFIAGDSAGGGLTLTTLLSLRDHNMPMPCAAVAISAFADLTLTSESMRSEASNDVIMHPNCLPWFAKYYAGDADVRDPMVSPVFADYTGLPPLLFQVGEHEVIRDDSVKACAKAKADGVDATLEVWPKMIHVFQSHAQLPEAAEAITRIGGFFRSHSAG